MLSGHPLPVQLHNSAGVSEMKEAHYKTDDRLYIC